MTHTGLILCYYEDITDGGRKRNTCIIQLDLIWDQLLSPLPLLVSLRRNGTCQNKGSEIRLEQSWAGHLGGEAEYQSLCLLSATLALPSEKLCVKVQVCVEVCVCESVCMRVRHLAHFRSCNRSTDAFPPWAYATRAASMTDRQTY